MKRHIDESFLYDPGKMEFEFKANLFHKDDSTFVLSYLIKNDRFFRNDQNAPHTLVYKCYRSGSMDNPAMEQRYVFDTISTRKLYIQKNETFTFASDSFIVYVEVLNQEKTVLAHEYIPFSVNDVNFDYYFYKNTRYNFDPFLVENESYAVFSYFNKINSYSFFSDTISTPDTLYFLNTPIVFDTSNVIVAFYCDSVFRFSKYLFAQEDFKLEQPQSLADPLAMFAEYFEYNDSLKFYIDKFWLQCTDFDMVRSKELIRVFYNRVISANKYFTSYIKGWQTDRGRAYVLMGLPNSITRDQKGEKWVYESQNHGGKTIFYFEKKEYYNASNHYVVNNRVAYDLMMKKAIASWKKGVVYYY